MMQSEEQPRTVGLSTTCCKDQGFVLITTLVLLALMTALGLTALKMTDLEVEMGANLHSGTEAFYLAEAGLQRAIEKIAEDNDWPSDLADPSDAFAGGNTLGGGTYVVEVFDDEPNVGEARLRSTGTTTGLDASSATVELVGTKATFPPILDYAMFSCSDFSLTNGENDIHDGDIFVDGDLDLYGTGNNKIEDGNVYVTGDLNLDKGWIRGGNVFVNGNASLDSQFNPNIDGDLASGGSVSGSGTVTGITTANVSPAPVTDLCDPAQLPKTAIPAESIQDYRDNADSTVNGNYIQSNGSIPYTGVAHVTGNLELSGNMTLTGNVIFIVDGNTKITGPGKIQSSPAGSTVTFLVPSGNFVVEGNGNFQLDGSAQVGTVNQDGTGLQGGNFELHDSIKLNVDGSVSVLNGNITSEAATTLEINQVPAVDSNLMEATPDFFLLRWQEIRN